MRDVTDFRERLHRCSLYKDGALVQQEFHVSVRDTLGSGGLIAEEYGREFLRLMRRLTVTGFYTSKVGMEVMDYPGFQTMWTEMPDSPHKDNPKYPHLQSAPSIDENI
jgi:hypothetical protein